MRFAVAIDGSDASVSALEHATRLAEPERDALTLVHVVNPDVYAETASEPLSNFDEAAEHLVATVEDAETRGERVLSAAADRAADHGFAVDSELLYGSPATELAEYAERGGYDGIFVGHTGKSENAERVLGSVAKDLVALAACPVTVVR